MNKYFQLLASPMRSAKARKIRQTRRKLQKQGLDPLPLSLLLPYLESFPRAVHFYIPRIAPLISSIEYEKNKTPAPQEGQCPEPYYTVIGIEEDTDILILKFYHEKRLEYQIRLQLGGGNADVIVCDAHSTSHLIQTRYSYYSKMMSDVRYAYSKYLYPF